MGVSHEVSISGFGSLYRVLFNLSNAAGANKYGDGLDLVLLVEPDSQRQPVQHLRKR
jgi:hypothetical protein